MRNLEKQHWNNSKFTDEDQQMLDELTKKMKLLGTKYTLKIYLQRWCRELKGGGIMDAAGRQQYFLV